MNSIEETILFYGNILGFECANRMDGWAALRRDSVELMISLPNAHQPLAQPMLTGSNLLQHHGC